MITTTKEHFGITLTVDKSMNNLIYRNGVFAVQGVRPVFSSVSDILEGNLSKMIFEAIMSGDKKIAITYDEKAKRIVAALGKRVTINIPYAGRLDKVRDRNIVDVVANVSVREAGHAVVYGALFGLAPLWPKRARCSTPTRRFCVTCRFGSCLPASWPARSWPQRRASTG